MPWTKQSDDFADDCWGLSDAAYRLHNEGLIWSNKKLLDCRVPKEDIRRFKRPEALNELLELGYWEEDGDCYAIRHHAVHQRSREDVLAQQAANLANGRKGGRPPKRRSTTQTPTEPTTKPETQSVSETQSDSESESDWATESGTERDRDLFGSSGTDGSRSVGGSGGKTRRKQAGSAPAIDDAFEDFWSAWPRKVSKKAAREKFRKVVKAGADPSRIVAVAQEQADEWRRANKEIKFVPHATTWLNQDRFDDPIEKSNLRLVSNSDSPWGGTYTGPESPWASGWS